MLLVPVWLPDWEAVEEALLVTDGETVLDAVLLLLCVPEPEELLLGDVEGVSEVLPVPVLVEVLVWLLVVLQCAKSQARERSDRSWWGTPVAQQESVAAHMNRSPSLPLSISVPSSMSAPPHPPAYLGVCEAEALAELEAVPESVFV